jgi:hypothetical protein
MRLAVLVLVACGGATTQDSIDFVGGFAARFPIPPTWHHPGHGGLVEAHAVEDKKAYEFAVRYDELPVGEPREQAIENTRDAILRGTKMTIASENRASLGDVQGIEIFFTRKTGVAFTRVFATSSRVYEISAAAPSEEPVLRFHDSFRLVP